MGCASDSLPFVRLGVPMGHNMSQVNVWSFILDRFWSRLSGWKAKCLSFRGWLTLLKSVLGSLGNYLVLIFLVPFSVLRYLEALRARYFFWCRKY